jgi:hypothetical protein
MRDALRRQLGKREDRFSSSHLARRSLWILDRERRMFEGGQDDPL